MAETKQSDLIRQLVAERYVGPAVRNGDLRLSVRVRDVLQDAEATPNFPRGRTPLICEVLQGKKLLTENGLEIERVDGPPSKQSRTVVVHYKRSKPLAASETGQAVTTGETPAEWAKRLTDKLRGLLKEELAEYGGAEGFIRWTRDKD